DVLPGHAHAAQALRVDRAGEVAAAQLAPVKARLRPDRAGEVAAGEDDRRERGAVEVRLGEDTVLEADAFELREAERGEVDPAAAEDAVLDLGRRQVGAGHPDAVEGRTADRRARD